MRGRSRLHHSCSQRSTWPGGSAWGYQATEVSYPLSYSMRISDKRGELSTQLYSVQIFTVMQHPKSLSSLITTCNGLSANDGNVNKLSKESVWSSSSKLSRESCTSTSTVLMPKRGKGIFLVWSTCSKVALYPWYSWPVLRLVYLGNLLPHPKN